MNLMMIRWRTVSYLFLIPWFLLVSIILPIINAFSTFFFERRIAQISSGTFDAAFTLCCCRVSESSMLVCSSISHWLSTCQSSSLSSGLSKSPFQLSQILGSEMLSGEESWSLWTGLRLIRLIRLIPHPLTTWVHPPGRFFPDKAGGKDDFSNNLNAAAPSYCNFN